MIPIHPSVVLTDKQAGELHMQIKDFKRRSGRLIGTGEHRERFANILSTHLGLHLENASRQTAYQELVGLMGSPASFRNDGDTFFGYNIKMLQGTPGRSSGTLSENLTSQLSDMLHIWKQQVVDPTATRGFLGLGGTPSPHEPQYQVLKTLIG